MNGALNKEEWLAACADLAKTYEHGWEEADKLMKVPSPEGDGGQQRIAGGEVKDNTKCR